MQYLRASLALIDSVSDVQFSYRIGKTSFHALFWSSTLTTAISFTISACAIIAVIVKRKSYIDGNIIIKHTFVYFVLAVLAFSDLELLCFLPWKYKLRSLINVDGFPDRNTVLVTSITIIFENLPQIIIQSVYLAAIDKPDYITIFSLVISGLSSLSKLFRIFIVFIFAESHEETADSPGLPTTEVTRGLKEQFVQI
jgi:hypothetical protein